MNTEDVKDQENRASDTHQGEESNEAETSTETESKNDALDYQKELEMARKELEKKDKRIGQAEHVIEKLKSEGSDVNQQNIEELVEKMVEERVGQKFQQVRGDMVENLISSYASSKDEAELIKFHLENSIKQSGDDVTDIINAKALANKARFTQQTSEINRAKMETEADDVKSAGAKDEQKPKMRLSADEKRIMKQFNLTEDDLRNGVRNK